MESVLSIASGLSPILQVLLIAILAVIFWEPIAQRLGWGGEREEKVPLWAQQLMQHYNHDTTDQNERIIDKLDGIDDKLVQSNQSLREIQQYGVKCRKD